MEKFSINVSVYPGTHFMQEEKGNCDSSLFLSFKKKHMVSFRDISQKLTLSLQTWNKATAQKHRCSGGGEKEHDRVSDPRAS